MFRSTLSRPIAAMLFIGTLASCGSVDNTLFSGDSTFAEFPGASSEGNNHDKNPKKLAKVEDPRIFLTTAAKISEQEQNYEAAAGNWGRLYLSDQKNAQYALKTAVNLRYIGRYEDADRILRQTLRENAGNADLTEELAETLIASGRLRAGATSLTSLAETPGMPQERVSKLRSAIGVAFDRAGKHKQAQTSYALALRADPLNAIALSNLGLSYALTGDLDLAESKLREALIAPNASIQVRQNLAMVLALKGDAKAAERLAKQDLPPKLAARTVSYYSNIGDQADVWSDAAAQ